MSNNSWSLPSGKFSTVVADPPWDYSKKLSGGGTSGYSPVHHSRGGSRGAANHYNTLSIDELISMPIEEIVSEQAHLYLWTTGTFISEAHLVAEAWGFSPKGIIPWIKMNRNWRDRIAGSGSMESAVRMGMGRYLRWCSEYVLFGVRGKLLPLRNDVRGVVFATQGRHSQKPEEIYDLIERVSPAPRIELFARSFRAGYVCWGDELTDADEAPQAQSVLQLRS